MMFEDILPDVESISLNGFWLKKKTAQDRAGIV